MKPGIYDLPFPEYRKIEAANNSSLSELKKSPKHAKHALETEKDPTAAMEFGTRSHLALFEPKKLEELHISSAKNRTFKQWKDDVALYGKENTILAKDYERLHKIINVLMNDPVAGKLIEQAEAANLFERSLVWMDPEHEILMKGRTDALVPNKGTILDLKTTTDASQTAFEKKIFDMGYHRAGYLYRAGANEVMPEVDWRHFIMLAVETKEPFGVQVFNLPASYYQLAERELSYFLPKWKRCVETGDWHDYSKKIVEAQPPAYAQKQVDRLTQQQNEEEAND